MKTSPAFSLQWRSLLFLAPGGLSHVLDRAGGDDPGHAVWQDPFQIFFPRPWYLVQHWAAVGPLPSMPFHRLIVNVPSSELEVFP